MPRADGVTTSPTRNFNTATLELAYAPNRGTFEFRLGYNFIANIFDLLEISDASSTVSRSYSALNYLSHDITARTRPLPLLQDRGGVRRRRHPHGLPGVRRQHELVHGPLRLDADPRARVGLNGLLTEKIALLALVGYQGTFYSGGDNADTVIGQAELPLDHLRDGQLPRWLSARRAEQLHSWQLRGPQPAYLLAPALLQPKVPASARRLRGLPGSTKDPARPDGQRLTSVPALTPSLGGFTSVRAEGTVYGEYRFTEIFGVNLTARVSSNITDVAIGLNRLDWTRFEAFAGLRLAW